MTTRCMSARSRSGQERILEAYHHLLYQALGLPRLLSLVDSWRSPPIRDRDQGGGGATGGPTISRPKAVGRATASIVTIPGSEHYHQYHEIGAIIGLDFRGN